MEGKSYVNLSSEDELSFSLHFFLKEENIHSMDAIVYNECERSLLQSIKELQKYIEFDIDIEVLAKEEGGVVGNYIIKGVKYTGGLVLASLIGAFFANFFNPKSTIHQEDMDKIAVIDKIKSGNYTQEEFDYIAQNDKPLKKLKNNFYKCADGDNEIAKIEVDADENIRYEISSNEFKNNIIEFTTKTEKIERYGITIHIVAPVIVKLPNSKLKWKGIYLDEPIDFIIRDVEFLKNVEQQKIKFGYGTSIKCNLEITRKIKYDEFGNEDESLSYVVKEIYEWEDETHFKHQLKTLAKANKNSQDLPTLFTEEDMRNSNF